MDQSKQTTDLPISSTSDPGNVPGDVNQNQQNNNNSDQNTTKITQNEQNLSGQPLDLSDMAAQASGSRQKPPAVPFSQPGQAASPTFSAQAVATQVNATDVPKESVGFSQVEAPSSSPPRSDMTVSPASVVPNISGSESLASDTSPNQDPLSTASEVSSPKTTPSDPRDTLSLPTADTSTPSPMTPTGSTNSPSSENTQADGEKSPLEILEEILAEANTEKSKEESAKKKKEDEDREFKEQLAAKEAAFQEQAAVEISQKRQEVEAAKQRRDDVEADLQSQGKGDDQAPDVTDEVLTIHQLEHDKVQ